MMCVVLAPLLGWHAAAVCSALDACRMPAGCQTFGGKEGKRPNSSWASAASLTFGPLSALQRSQDM